MFEYLRKKLTAILQREHWWAEFWSAVVALMWAAMSLWQPGIEGSPAYYALYASVPRAWMIGIGVAVSVVQIAGLIGNWATLRWVAAAMASWFYMMIFQSFLTDGYVLANIAPWLGYVGANIFVLCRLPFGLR